LRQGNREREDGPVEIVRCHLGLLCIGF
jgi:hypothetical protein